MASLNRWTGIGNVTRDPQVRYTPGGSAVVEVGLACNRVWYDKQTQAKKEDVAFLDVVFFGKQAETIGEYVTKGQSLYCEARLKLDSWDDKETGKKRYKLALIGESFQFLGSKSGGGGSGGGSREPAWKNTGEESQEQPAERKTADYFPDDDSVSF